ncbi:5358_t:CDS:2, partial [Funneliformis mosseae]
SEHLQSLYRAKGELRLASHVTHHIHAQNVSGLILLSLFQLQQWGYSDDGDGDGIILFQKTERS